MPLVLGAAVRIYCDDDSFDEGTICALTESHIDVEFYDWQQRWARTDLRQHTTWPDQVEVWCPIAAGEVIRRYQSHRPRSGAVA